MTAYPPELAERIQQMEGMLNRLYSAAATPELTMSDREPVSWGMPLPVALYAMSFRHGPAEPSPVSFEVRESDGVYTVVRREHDWGNPFETTDRELAVMVCDRWAREFPERDPGDGTATRADTRRIADELRLLSRRG